MKSFRQRPAEHTLAAVLEEARRVPAPELDWDAMQGRLWRSIDQAPKAESRRWSWQSLGAVAALAAATAGVFWLAPRTAPSPHATASIATQVDTLDGDVLARDELLQAGPNGLHVSHRGRAEWVLAPHASASVQEHGDVVRIRLVAGSLRAEVVPTEQKERFIVEAAGTRVAVHGTVFRVELAGDRNLVDVEEGVVAVGPLEPTQAVPVLLRAPTHAEFALAGSPLVHSQAVAIKQGAHENHASRRVRRWTATATPLASAPVEVTEATPAEPALPAATTEEPAPLPQRLNIGEVEEGVTPVVEAIARCFRENTPGSHSLKVSAQSAVTLSVAPEGSIEQVSFAPPLSPTVQSCSEHALSELRFAPSLEGASVTRVLELAR